MKVVIVDKYIDESVITDLEKLGFLPIRTQEIEGISTSLSTHPDIQVCKINDRTIVVDPRLYTYYSSQLINYGIMVIAGYSEVVEPYPDYIAYNACVTKGHLIHNLDHTDKAILDNTDLVHVNIKQGYSKCNILDTKDGIITSDFGIYKKVDTIRKLLVSKEEILLRDYNYGFIGGTSGYFDGCAYFIGDIYKHSDIVLIEEFLEEEATKIKVLGDIPLTDNGSLIFLDGSKKW